MSRELVGRAELSILIAMTLFCWVIGTATKRIFPTKIEQDARWGSVKKAIKEEEENEFADIDADTLDLWKVCYQPRTSSYAQLPTTKVVISDSQSSLLESGSFLKNVTSTKPLNPIVDGPQRLTSRRPCCHHYCSAAYL